MNTTTIYTIGHSNRSIKEFLLLLDHYSINILVDIRANPYSSRFPYFSKDALREALKNNGLEYRWEGRLLGGFREPSQSNPHVALRDARLKGFAEYMETIQFEQSIVQLLKLAASRNTAIMCAEKLASHCHRRLISDYLTSLKHVKVLHIIDKDERETHELNGMARSESARLIYDRHVSASLNFY